MPSARAPADGTWVFGEYRLEPAKRRLHHGDRVRGLDARALAVLECLLRRAERVVPRATLIAEAWPEAETVFDSAVSKVVRRLRIALGDGPGHVLQTIYGEGYRLALPAVLLPPQSGPPSPPASPADPVGMSGRPGSQPAAPLRARSGPAPSDRWARRAWLARLPWIIAVMATLVAACLAWLLMRPGSGA